MKHAKRSRRVAQSSHEASQMLFDLLQVATDLSGQMELLLGGAVQQHQQQQQHWPQLAARLSGQAPITVAQQRANNSSNVQDQAIDIAQQARPNQTHASPRVHRHRQRVNAACRPLDLSFKQARELPTNCVCELPSSKINSDAQHKTNEENPLNLVKSERQDALQSGGCASSTSASSSSPAPLSSASSIFSTTPPSFASNVSPCDKQAIGLGCDNNNNNNNNNTPIDQHDLKVQISNEVQISSTINRRRRRRKSSSTSSKTIGVDGGGSGGELRVGHLCQHCGRSFSRSDMLTRHSRLHSGHKPYQCSRCLQVFSRSDHLSTHERTHTGDKPYQCNFCPYSACRRDMITRHMRTHTVGRLGAAGANGQTTNGKSRRKRPTKSGAHCVPREDDVTTSAA